MLLDKQSLRQNRLDALQNFIGERSEEIRILEQNGYTREQAIEMMKLWAIEGIYNTLWADD